ncbi:lipopolysaccharide biosynthesis protein [Pedobacter jamesrossensis]|uniref:Lipopolysaccharide biosynthesis protein n=1 Tax=Pedobacter jamesrossensis TaxID=1908238 RepID=A0ABV8NHR2_9SPHI
MSNLFKKIIAIYKNVHFQSLFGNGVMAVIGLVSLGILYRTLSLTDVGIYIFVLTINGLMDTLRGGFLTITFIKFYSGTVGKRAEEVAGAAWFLGLAITALAVVINIPTYFLANYFTDASAVISLKYFSIIPVITLPSFMANCVVQSYKRFDRLLVLRVLNQGSFAVAVLVLALLHKVTLNSVLLTFVGSNLLSSVCVLIFRWTKVLSIKYANKETILELFHFGKYAMGTNISSSLFGLTSTFIVNFLIGPAALATCNLSSKFLQIIEIPLLSFAASGMPILSAQYNNGEKPELMYTLKKLVGMLSVALVPIAVFVLIFAEPLIHVMGGKEYVSTEAPNLLRIMIVCSLLWPADRFFALALDVIHLPKINFYKIWVMLIVNVIAIAIGLALYKSVYSITVAMVFPTIVAIVMAYRPLNNFSKFSFWSVYVIGYKESLLFIKEFSRSLFNKA